MTWLIVAAVICAPALRLAFSHDEGLRSLRDWWLRGVIALGCLLAWSWAPWLIPIGCWFLWNWQGPKQLPSVILWAGVGATWALLGLIPAEHWRWIGLAWAGVGTYQNLELGWLAWTGKGQDGRRRWAGLLDRQRGALGTSAMTALSVALLAPFATVVLWPVWALGLWLTCSWAAWLALAAGASLYEPGYGPWMALGLAVGVGLVWWNPHVRARKLLEWTPRRDTLRTLTQRVEAMRALVWGIRETFPWGAGPGQTERFLQRWSSVKNVPTPTGNAFMEPLQFVFEYGVLGALSLGLFCWPVVQHLRPHDPWSAAWVIGVVLAGTHWPMRLVPTALVWLAVSAKLVTA